MLVREPELRQLGDHVVQVVGVGVPLAVFRRPELCLVGDRLIPDDAAVGDGEGQPLVEGRFEQPQNSPAFFGVRKKSRPGEPDREERLARLRMPDTLEPVLDVVGDLNGVVIFETREAFGDHLVGHARAHGGHVALHHAGNLVTRRALWAKKDNLTIK